MKETSHQAAEILCIVKGVLLWVLVTLPDQELGGFPPWAIVQGSDDGIEKSTATAVFLSISAEVVDQFSNKMLYYSLIVRASQIKCAL